jgi:hypothetical protein
MKKVLPWAVAGLAALLALLVLSRNFIARKSVELAAQRITGFPLTIESVQLGLFNGRLDASGLKLMNPPEFPDRKTLRVDYRLGSMLAGAPHLNDMLVDIDQVVIVKNTNGVSNAQKLKGVTSSDKPSRAKYRLDLLRIRVGTVTVKDYTRGRPSEKRFPLNITATYRDITDSTDITRLVLMTVVSQARIPEIGISPNDLKNQLRAVGGLTREALGATTNILQQTGKSLLDPVKNAAPQK